MSKTLCPIPWIFLAVRNNGDYRICCQANVSPTRGLIRGSEGQILNARDAHIDEARNSEIMKSTRVDMLEGRWPESCVRCKNEESSGLTSRRMYETKAWSLSLKEAQELTAPDGTLALQSSPIRYFDVRFGNKCNLACRMCGPSDSNFWYQDHVQLTGQDWFHDTHGKVQLQARTTGKGFEDSGNSYNWYELEHFWQQLELHSKDLKHIYLAGGEPLLIDQHYLFLEKCVERGYASNISIEYNTNITVLPPKVLELWKHFRLVRLGLSVDGIGEVLEYQRWPAKWNVLKKNIEKVNKLEQENVQAWLACTVTNYNVFHIPDFVEWKLASSLANINRSKAKPIITHHMAHKPEHLNVRSLPQELKAEVVADYALSLERIRIHYGQDAFLAAQRIYGGITNYMNAENTSESFWSQFCKYTSDLDRIRNQNHAQALDGRLSAAISQSL